MQLRVDVFGIGDVPQLLEGEELEEVHRAFQEQVKNIEENPSRFENSEELKVGFEVEYTLLDSDNNQASEQVRDRIKDKQEFLDSELAASVIEARTDPVSEPDSLREFGKELRDREHRAAELAAEEGFDLLRYGTNPFPDLDEFERSGDEDSRYEMFANFLDEARNDEMVHDVFGIEESFDPRDIHYSGMIASTQTNLQAQSLGDAVEKANFGYMFAPFAEALGANARVMEQKDTGISDIRMPVWEKSADVREDEDFGSESPRAGKIDSYIGKEDGHDIEDYFERLDPVYVAPDVEEAPDAIDQAVMNNWKDINIKFTDDAALVELRPFSIQPTVQEDLALSAFMMGRIAYAQDEKVHGSGGEDLLDIEKVNRNRYTAMHNGLDEKLYDSSGNQRQAVEVVQDELEYARQGLNSLGVDYENFVPGDQDLFDYTFGERLEEGIAPGDQSAERYNELRENMSDEQALAEVMKDYKVSNRAHDNPKELFDESHSSTENEDEEYDTSQFTGDGGFVGPS